MHSHGTEAYRCRGWRDLTLRFADDQRTLLVTSNHRHTDAPLYVIDVATGRTCPELPWLASILQRRE